MSEPTPKTPDSRRFARAIDGTATVLSDGQTWHVCDYVPCFTSQWDNLYRDNVGVGAYDAADVDMCFYALLVEHYSVSDADAVQLIRGADQTGLINAVEIALLGHPQNEYREYSDWVAACLESNGLVGDRRPSGRRLKDVLDMLVRTGKAVPADKWIGVWVNVVNIKGED